MPSLHAGPEAPYSFDQAFRNGAGVNFLVLAEKWEEEVQGLETERPFPVAFKATVTFLPQE